MGHGWSCTVEPGTLVHMPGSYESRGGHLLSVEPKSNVSGAVLSLRQGTRDSLGREARVLSVSASLRFGSNILIVEASLVLQNYRKYGLKLVNDNVPPTS